MSDALLDAYQSEASAKQLWDKLEAKYMAKDASSKKFLVSRFNNYKMVDNRSVIEQLHELEHILNSFKQYGLKMDEAIVVSSIIDKILPSWRDIKKTLKHKKEDMSLEDLGNHLQIEEDYRKQEEVKQDEKEKDSNEKNLETSKVQMMEHKSSNKAIKRKHFVGMKDKSHKFKRDKKGPCFHCNKHEHFKAECKLLKNKTQGVYNNKFVVVVSEVNIFQDDKAWWIDTSATNHVCNNKSFFKTLEAVND
ncbi:hypothetical protein QQP08_010786 [Theobroma cacao]|nr:hypothetical protein QQP08_010786 [Theobroma cacao]